MKPRTGNVGRTPSSAPDPWSGFSADHENTGEPRGRAPGRRLASLFLAITLAAGAQTRILWRDPDRVVSEPPVQPPRAPFTFLREDPSGTQPKLFARDAAGVTWNVKFGNEVKNESFCWRIVRACGYFAEPGFFVAQGRLENFQPLKRGSPSLGSDGHFTAARFQYRDPQFQFLPNGNWRWDRPPFAGTKELSGLKILIMLFSNWDNKDGRVGAGGPNTAIFRRGNQRIYAFTDWGSGMGRWGSGVSGQTDWRCEDYAAQTPGFIKGVQNGHVVFGWEGEINEGFRTGIPAAHVTWFMQYLGRITDAQINDALKAAGGTDAEADCFTRALRARIRQLAAIR